VRIGVFTPLLSSLPLEEVLKKIAKLDISTVELGTGNYLGDPHCKLSMLGSKSELVEFKRILDDHGIGHRSSPNQLLLKDPSLLKPEARSYADLPGGHSEGYDDTFKQVFRRFYRSIENPDAKRDYPQFVDGLRQLNILDAEFESNERQGWVNVD